RGAGPGDRRQCAIFSVINSILLHPPGIAEPERMVAIRVKYDKLNLKDIGTSAPDYANVRDSRNVFSSAVLFGGTDFNYTAGSVPERLVGTQVGGQFFEVFGVKPL